jgi:teichuronic acid biosynthesis glycosyltransferase TuaC
MKILFLSAVYPHPTAPVRGTFNRELCRALTEFAEVRVISPVAWTERIKNPLSARSDDSDLNVSYPTYYYTPKMLRNSYGKFMWKSVRRQVERTLEDFQPDWVLSYWAHPDGEAGLRAARAAGAQAGVIVGGSDILLLTEDPSRRQRILEVLRESDAVFSVSEALHRRAMVLGAMPSKIHTVYQGVNADVFKPGFKSIARQNLDLSTGERIFLWVGRMVRVKRLDRLITAFAGVHKIESTAKLALVGDGELMSSVRRQVAELGLTDNVILPGAVPADELGDWYRAADATVLSSESEGLPNAFRESLACGTPFVSTEVGSVREISNDAYSIVVPVDDSAALTHAMARILHPDYENNAGQFLARTWRDCAHDYAAVMAGQSHVPLSDIDAGLRPAEDKAIAGNVAGLEAAGSMSMGGAQSTLVAELPLVNEPTVPPEFIKTVEVDETLVSGFTGNTTST